MITNETVKYIASLSRLHIEEDRLPVFRAELESILQYIDQLAKLEVANVPPTSHVFQMENVFRDDVVAPSLTPAEAMSFAIDQHSGHYKVPKVIE
ncbi:MAG: Asp-tRNA(Asn)/Glu-tRNA(Gln) amidotransferase subunit GatC [Candidatus Omnitrophica bacterium]|nr:Asp-tRNA(Asn)/Glu-tRNA(Gln) amidotransferase subunit GatC [Candidatus Omnitrophota bacterium]